MNIPEKRILFGDVLLCVVVVVSAVLLIVCRIFFSGESTKVVVTSDSGRMEYGLNSDVSLELESNGHKLTLEIRDGSACVSRADCPDKVCVSMGKISRPGSSIICVPAHVSIAVVGDQEVDYAIK